MKKHLIAAVGAILITTFWSVGMMNATAQYRQSFIAPMLTAA